MKRALLLATLMFGTAIAAALSVMWALVRYEQRQFEKLATHALVLRPGESTLSQVEEFSRNYQSQATIEIENGCTPASCELEIILTNFLAKPSYGGKRPSYRHWLNRSFLRRLGIRPAEVRLFVMVRQDKVEVVFFTTAYESPTGLWTLASWGEFAQFKQGFQCEIEAIQRRHPDYYLLDYESGPSSPYQDISVSACFRKEASEEERKRCRLINFSCMTSLFDCAKERSAAQFLMPQIYQDLLEDEAIRNPDRKRYSDTLWNCTKRPEN